MRNFQSGKHRYDKTKMAAIVIYELTEMPNALWVVHE